MAEKVICFRRSLLESRAPCGPVFYDGGLWGKILPNLEPLQRNTAESDDRYKQLVVYAVIESGGKYLSYTRTGNSTERRLRFKRSIGIGGHVNMDDGLQPGLFELNPLGAIIEQALWREINEEIRVDSALSRGPELLCFINDDSSEVGRVHFGIVWLVSIEEPRVCSRREKGIGKLKFAGLSSLSAEKAAMEDWSGLLIEYLSEKQGLTLTGDEDASEIRNT